jgi:competence protein ComEC
LIDGRLLLPAAGAWGGAALTLVALGSISDLPQRHRTAGGLTVMVLAVVCIGALVWFGYRDQPLAVGVAVTGFGVAAGVIAAAAQVVALTAPPLADWVENRRTVLITGIVNDEPFTRINTSASTWQSGSITTVRFSTTTIEGPDRRIQVEVPITLRVDDPTVVPEPGSHVQFTGRLSAAAPLRHAAANVQVQGGFVVLQEAGIIDSAALSMRHALRTSIESLAPQTGALVAGLAIGDESGAPQQLTDAMLNSGLSHLTAVSGGNVAIIVVIVLGAAALVRLPMPARITLTLLALGFFVILVRPQPSVLRASVMGGVVLVGMLTGGRRGGPAILSTSILLLMVLSPHLAVAWGFSLSVAATGGLILLAPWVRMHLDTWTITERWPPPIRTGLAITGAAQLATLPLLVAMGGAVGWVALPANLLAMPAVVPVTVFGLLAAATGVWAPGLAVVWATLAAPGAWWISQVAAITSSLPGARLPWPSGWLAAFVLVPIAAAFWFARHRLGLAIIAAVCVMVVWTIAPPERRGWPPPGWLMVTCDVGQGDAHVLNIGPGAAVVVDVGPDPEAIDRCLTDLGVWRIPAIVLSHFHADHVNGLPGALRHRDVQVVLATPLLEPTEQVVFVREAIGEVPLAFISFGEVRTIGPLTWRVLWPRRIINTGSRPNNASVVLHATLGDRRILFTGDAEPEAQAAFLPDMPQVDIVKVPHHGSRFQHPSLASKSGAQIALIGVGEGNDYGHPAEQTLIAWQHALIGRTDTDGDIAVVDRNDQLGLTRRTERRSVRMDRRLTVRRLGLCIPGRDARVRQRALW